MEADPTASWFDGRELKLSAAGDDKSEMFVDPAACVYPDAFLRLLAGGRDDCGLLKPGADDSEILTLPFLALTAWVLGSAGSPVCTIFTAIGVCGAGCAVCGLKDWCRAGRIGGVRPNAGTAGRAGITERLRGAMRAEPVTPPTSSARAE